MKRLAGIGDLGINTDASSDRFDVSSAGSGLGTPELLDDRRMLSLRVCHVLRLEIAEPLLGSDWSNRDCRRS